MNLYNVRFEFDGEKLRGTGALAAEAMHTLRIELPPVLWVEPVASGDPCDLLDRVVEQLANQYDMLYANARKLRRKREQGALW
jgi:hypothetical protein